MAVVMALAMGLNMQAGNSSIRSHHHGCGGSSSSSSSKGELYAKDLAMLLLLLLLRLLCPLHYPASHLQQQQATHKQA
jgi:hypothetical protein